MRALANFMEQEMTWMSDMDFLTLSSWLFTCHMI